MGRLERPKQRLAKAYYSAAPIAQRARNVGRAARERNPARPGAAVPDPTFELRRGARCHAGQGLATDRRLTCFGSLLAQMPPNLCEVHQRGLASQWR